MSESPIDRALYPFAGRFFEHPEGRMHYLDVGEGTPIVLVHGTPTWSFLFRKVIGELAARHRVIAPDHLGFGLSDKPRDAPYRPEDHARRLETLIDALELKNVTLVVHDFGGPVGLSYAVRHPEKVCALVLFNTWMWSLAGSKTIERASKVLGGPIGRLLYTRLNFSPRVLLPSTFGDRSKLTREVHRHYLDVFSNAAEREAPWVLARELIDSSDWYDSLWQQRDHIHDKPALLLWGMKDPTFGSEYLTRWESAFTHSEVVRFPEVGHLVPEEAGTDLGETIGGFLRNVPCAGRTA